MSKDTGTLWDPPEYLDVNERLFLEDRAKTICNIQQAAWLAMAQVLDQVRTKFKNDPKLDGWFYKWIETSTPLTVETAKLLLAIGKGLKEEPELLEVANSYTKTATAVIARLPPKSRSRVVKELLSSELQLSQKQLIDISQYPEVELEKAESLVQQLQTTLANLQLQSITGATAKDRSNAKHNATQTERSLQLALQRLTEARAKIKDLEADAEEGSRIEQLLRAQLREKKVQLEEATLDPEAKKKRAVARTIVDAGRGLDLLLESLDKYSLAKQEIGQEAITALERKMLLVQEKLASISPSLV